MPAKVVWSEGMLLTPQHLQLGDTQRDLDAWGRIQAMHGAHSGVFGLEFDGAELAGGQLVLKRLSAILADGTLVDAPSHDLLPPARSLPSGASDRPVGALIALADSTAVLEDVKGRSVPRYSVEEWKIEDPLGSGRSRRIEVARPSLRVVFEGEPTDGMVTLKVGEFVRDGTGRWQAHARYLPPLLRIDASPALRRILEDTLVLLVSCRRGLIERRGTHAPTDLSAADTLLFWFLYSLNGAIGGLEHVLEVGTLPPERAYDHLRTCAAYLTTFSDDLAPMDLPPLRRDDLHGSFDGLTGVLRRLLETMLPVHHVQIPMQKQGQNLWRADIPGNVVIESADPLLILCGAAPDGRTHEDVREAIKVASARDIDFIVRAALRGIELQLLARPPSGVHVRGEALYLRLRKSAPFWDPLCQSRELAVYLPGHLMALTPQLVFVS